MFPTGIQSITVFGDRIWVGDMCESVFLCKYKKAEKQLQIVADTTSPRYLTATCIVDYDTIAGLFVPHPHMSEFDRIEH